MKLIDSIALLATGAIITLLIEEFRYRRSRKDDADEKAFEIGRKIKRRKYQYLKSVKKYVVEYRSLIDSKIKKLKLNLVPYP
jgi:hypothetical protein